jgi:hypothetical protein
MAPMTWRRWLQDDLVRTYISTLIHRIGIAKSQTLYWSRNCVLRGSDAELPNSLATKPAASVPMTKNQICASAKMTDAFLLIAPVPNAPNSATASD